MQIDWWEVYIFLLEKLERLGVGQTVDWYSRIERQMSSLRLWRTPGSGFLCNIYIFLNPNACSSRRSCKQDVSWMCSHLKERFESLWVGRLWHMEANGLPRWNRQIYYLFNRDFLQDHSCPNFTGISELNLHYIIGIVSDILSIFTFESCSCFFTTHGLMATPAGSTWWRHILMNGIWSILLMSVSVCVRGYFSS